MEFKIREKRREMNLTQKELSEKSGVGRVTIVRLETGKQAEISAGTLVQLAKALNCSIDELVVA